MATEQPLFDNAVKDYLESCSTIKLSQNIRLGIPEFEIRFGISKPVSKTENRFQTGFQFSFKTVSKPVSKTGLATIKNVKLIYFQVPCAPLIRPMVCAMSKTS